MLALLLALAATAAVENQRPGSPGWEITSQALRHEIEDYASRASVSGGDPIDLFVSTRDARYTIDVFRMGWYAGAGARQVAGPIPRDGIAQEITDVDTRERPITAAGAPLRHRVFLSIGHDEYWSSPMRTHVESARDLASTSRFSARTPATGRSGSSPAPAAPPIAPSSATRRRPGTRTRSRSTAGRGTIT